METIISKLSQIFNQDELSTVVSSLRQDRLVWSSLQDAGFVDQAIASFGSNIKAWTPANIAFLAIGQEDLLEKKDREEYSSFPSKLGSRAFDILDETQSQKGTVTLTPSIENAALLIVALYEKRRSAGTWKGLFDGLTVNGRLEEWHTAFAGLLSVIPDRSEFLKSLSNLDHSNQEEVFPLNAVLSQPIDKEAQIEVIYDLLSSLDSKKKLALLDHLNALQPSLADVVGSQVLSDETIASYQITDALTDFEHQLYLVKLNQIVGRFSEAKSLMNQAWSSFESIKLEFNSEMALAAVRRQDFDSAKDILESVSASQEFSPRSSHRFLTAKLAAGSTQGKRTSVEMVSNSEQPHPIDLLFNARIEMERGERASARSLIKKSFAMAEQMFTDGKGISEEVLSLLLDSLIEHKFHPEAEQVAEIILSQNPNRADTLLKLSDAQQQNHFPHKSVETAATAVSLEPRNLSYRRKLIELLSSTRQWETALDEVARLIEQQDEPGTDDLFLKANIAFHAGDLGETYDTAALLLEKDQHSGLAHTLMGEALLSQGQEEKADECFDKAIQSSPQLVRPWLAKAAHLERSGNYSAAAEMLEKALTAVPDNLQLLARYGQIQRAIGQKPKASKIFVMAANLPALAPSALEESLEEDYLSIYENLQELNQTALSAEFIQKAIDTFPGHPELVHAYARSLIESGEAAKASDLLETVAALKPTDHEVRFDIARIHIEAGEQRANTKAILETALQLDPDNPVGLVMRSQIETPETGDINDIRLYTEALDDPDLGSIYWRKYLVKNFAETAMQAGKPEIAIDQLVSAQDIIGSDPYLMKIQTEAYRLAGLPEDALATAQKLFRINPLDPDMLEWYSEQAILLGAPDQAVAALEKAVEANPGDSGLLVEIGKIYANNQDVPAAIATFERLLQSKQASPFTLHTVAKEIIALSEPQAAVPFLQKALQLSSQPNLELLQDLAAAQESSGDLNGALMTIADLLDISPKDTALLQKKAELEIALGKVDAALRSIDDSLAVDPNNLSLIAKSAQLHRQIGDLPSAIDHAHRGLALDPENPDIRFLAADLQRVTLNSHEAWDLMRSVEWTIDDLESLGANRADEKVISAVGLQAELALELGHLQTAEKVIESARTNQHPRILALQARLAAMHADHEISREKLSSAIQALEEGDANVELSAKHAVALAASALNDWDTAIRLSRELAEGSPSEPLYSLAYAKNLISRAEHQHACQAVQAVSMAPGVQSLAEDAYRRSKRALDKAGAPAVGEGGHFELARWQTRAELAFDRSIPPINTAADSPPDMEEIAAHVKALARRGNRDEAIVLAGQQREYPIILAALADLHVDQDIEMARQYAVKAVDLDDTPENHARVAYIAARAEKTEDALMHISSALEHFPDEPRWNLLAGKLNLQIGRGHAAADYLNKAIEAEPDLADAHIYLGKTLLALGDHQAAVDRFKVVEHQAADRIEVMVGLAEGHMKGGNLAQASKYARKAGAGDPDLVAPKLIEAQIALHSQKFEKALSITESALALSPNDPNILAAYFEVLLALDRQDEALEAVQKAIDLSPNPVPFLLQKADVIRHSKGLEEGLQELQSTAKRYPNDPQVLSRLSQATFETGELDAAIQLAQKALRSPHISNDAPEAAHLHLMLGRQLDEAGQLDQAIHHLAQAIALAPSQVEAYLEAGRVQQKRRRSGEALAYYKQAASLAPSDHRPFMESGLLYKEIKDFTQAEHMLRRASDLAPKNAVIQRHLAATITLNLVHPNPKFTGAKAEA